MLFSRPSRIPQVDREIERNFAGFLLSLEDSDESLGKVCGLIRILGKVLNDDAEFLRGLGYPALARRFASQRFGIFMRCLWDLWKIGRGAYFLRRRAMAGGAWDFRSLWTSRLSFAGHMGRLFVAGLCYRPFQRLGFRVASGTLRRLSAELWPELAHGVD